MGKNSQHQEIPILASPVPGMVTGKHALELAVSSVQKTNSNRVGCYFGPDVPESTRAWVLHRIPTQKVILETPDFAHEQDVHSNPFSALVSCTSLDSDTTFASIPPGIMHIFLPYTMPYSGKKMPRIESSVDLLVVDTELSSCISPSVTAASMGPALLDLATSCLVLTDPIALCWIESACTLMLQHEMTWKEQLPLELWEKVSRDTMTAELTTVFCSGKRGSSTILQFAEALSVEGIATLQDASYALLKPLLVMMETYKYAAFNTFSACLGGRNPHDVVHQWSMQSGTECQEERLRTLCKQVFHLFEDVQVVRELRPMLAGIDTCGIGSENRSEEASDA